MLYLHTMIRNTYHMTWQYNKEDFTDVPKGMEGFVYVITNLTNNKKYPENC